MQEETIARLLAVTPEEALLRAGGPIDLYAYNRDGSPVMDPGQLLPHGELFGIRPHTRFVDFPRHSHRYVEMIYQVRGQTQHTIDGVTRLTLTAGRLLLLSRGTEHAIEAAGETDLAVNFILIPAFFDNAAISLGENNALSVFLKGNLSNRTVPGGYLIYDVSEAVLIQNLLENLIEGQFLAVSLRIQQLTLELLLQHLSGLSEKLLLQTQRAREQAMVLDLLSGLERDVRRNLSEYAKDFGLDVTVLSRLIHRYTGCTFTQLLQTARFNRAVALLRDSELCIADVATAVGYENTAFFYRRFGERFGCTPAVYRKRLRS